MIEKNILHVEHTIIPALPLSRLLLVLRKRANRNKQNEGIET
jgi:hypothetical protein